MLLFLLGACGTATLTGEVRTIDGGSVAGAQLASPGCDAVTAADGRFRVRCPKGTRSFTVSHPDHLDRTWPVSASSYGDNDVGSVELAAIPLGEGLWLAEDGRLTLLPQAPVVRTAGATEQRWCMDGSGGDPVGVPAGPTRLLDNHGVDWRLFRLDAAGCAYRTRKTDGENWTFDADRLPVGTGVERGPGRTWVELDLEAGDYALVEWYEGFLVQDEHGWRGHWLRAGGPRVDHTAGAAPLLDDQAELNAAP